MIASAKQLVSAVHRIVTNGGSDAREADLVATNLVEANLRGHDSHGVGMVPRYIESLLGGELVPNQRITVVRDAGVFLTLDGNRGYGQAVGFEAMNMAIARTRETGLAAVGLTNAHHLGRIGHWAEQCTAAGMVSLHFVNVLSRPIVAPWGGRDARIGTNPITIGIPRTGAPPIIVDMATSKSAQGKIRVAFNRGEKLPDGTLLDDQGEPTNDPIFGVREPYGALLPFAEHKGYALAVACELLGGALAGGEAIHGRDGRRRVHNGMLSIVIDPVRAGTAENLARETTAFVDFVTASPRRDGVDRVRMPGDPERETRAKREVSGIALDETTWAQIVDAGVKVGVEAQDLSALVGAS
ncbi:MAG: malate/lactate/ureidoglycolate dehydrogenase [Candidatus Rokubacteria bacterium]|nr:malate/lactate/ureidoglycolate dehydrogenase [Candidatus Rokubacteria bacterium]